MTAEFKVEYIAFQDGRQEKFMVTEKTTFGQFCNAILDRFVNTELEKDIVSKTKNNNKIKYVIRICSSSDKEWIVISSISRPSGSPIRWKLRPCHPDLSIFKEVPRHFNVLSSYENL